MAMLLGLVRPDDGSGTILGHPLAATGAYLSRVGALIETSAFHPGLTGHQSLRLLSLLQASPVADVEARCRELIAHVGLTGRGDDRVGTYSLGMKQRLAIAGALLNDPDLVILDEPANGVDSRGMRDLRHIIGAMARDGRTVLVSSHLLATGSWPESSSLDGCSCALPSH